MRAAVLEDHGEPLSIEDVDAPDPDPAGAVVDVEACGVCRSDWHGWQGDWGWLGLETQPGQILGHEPAGTVVAVGDDVENVSEGDHVAVPFNLGDGTCHECRRGHSNTCENVMPLGFIEPVQGAFAEQLHVPAADHNLVELPDGVSSVDMAGLGCRFMTSFHALAHRADVSAGDWVSVHGVGGVGLSAVHIADALGANVIAVDLTDEKLEKARELGAVETVNADDVDNVAAEVKAIADGGANVSMDALGIETTSQNSVQSLGNRGQHLQIGLTTQDEQGMITVPSDAMVMQEIEFIGSLGMPPTRYDEIFRMVATGKLRPADVVSETIDLEDVNDKLEAMTDYETEGIPVIDTF
ncbi:alcohol dehydrogenase catalytic domain-containing protein [Natronorubrum sp. JWXQ-INN-674]|uniref:Alcohol dehydrogenase catalytic domain-containing protein n=1 Tax=Natronorubrum halalkaliphilum TaxID=2691917 RepID=A0A6B0VPJ6_9EURY|nr:zinc-dependent alcohol dehydrogenase family protein [Natronorubrum halalkaliphilum]MXV62906.1 alcohol dehydrogenase catalytic domain-containing protein [Natronorubrum halalkaliphilum]